jgi:hypothetical protein
VSDGTAAMVGAGTFGVGRVATGPAVVAVGERP